MRIARRYLISGIVQGVGYRYFTKRKADLYGITGFVRNLPDGRVEVYAEGDPEVLNEFEKELWKGPAFAKVTSVEVVEEKPGGKYFSFEIAF